MNKTPIQELIDLLTGKGLSIDCATIQLLMSSLQKEKAFAFDCFMRGADMFLKSESALSYEQQFEQFYKNYTNETI